MCHAPNASTFIGHEGLTTRQGCSMGETLTHKLIRSHLAEGATHPGEEIAIRMDQALLQDATGTLAWLEFEQMGQDRVAIRHATQYVDHNILQTGYENADDHRFLRSVCQRYGALFSDRATESATGRTWSGSTCPGRRCSAATPIRPTRAPAACSRSGRGASRSRASWRVNRTGSRCPTL